MPAFQSLVPILLTVCFLAAQSLKLHESERSSSSEGQVKDHSVVKVLHRSSATQDEALRSVKSQIAPAQCQAVTETLRAGEDTVLAGRLFQIACENQYECEAQLPDMSTGCLVASKNRHLEAMLATIGRPNPCAFASLFFNSLFGVTDCPAEKVQSGKTTSQGGLTYAACIRGSGFTTEDEGCAAMTKISDTKPGVVDIYAVDAVIGLPESWQRSMNSYRLWHHSGQPGNLAKREKADLASVQRDKPLKIKFFSCPIAASSAPVYSMKDAAAVPKEEMSGLCRKQVDVLQQGFDGQLTCNHLVYNPPFGDSGIRFAPYESSDLTFIEDDMCNMCEYNYESLWQKYMPEERGVLKVLLCKCMGLLGVSAFPWSSTRGTMFDYRTLPEGGMHNYDMGRTMVHEFGHYFGLWHTFQGGCIGKGDRMDDTNKESMPFFGCPDETAEKFPATCGDQGVDPVHNLMDYSDDRCMCSFTPDQRDKINEVAVEYIFPLAD